MQTVVSNREADAYSGLHCWEVDLCVGKPDPQVILRSLFLTLVFGLGVAACQSTAETSQVEQGLAANPVIYPANPVTTFNSTQVGSTSNTLSFGVRTTTNDSTLTINAITYSCPDYTISASLPGYADRTCQTTCFTSSTTPQIICPYALVCANTDYSFSAVFHPSIAATTSCVVTVVTDAGNLSLTLTGPGTPPPIHVATAPGSVNFGGVRINTDSSPVAISVVNSGGSAATINSVATSAGFAIVSGNPAAHLLDAGASEAYGVVCHPPGVGGLNGSISISSNDPTTPNVSIPLACSGIDSALAIAPSPATLPTIRVGEAEQQTISITNMGNAATSIQSVTVTGLTMVSAPPGGTVLPASGGSASVVVSFAGQAAGSTSGTLHIDYDNGKSIDTQITAKAVATSLSLSPDGDVDLGTVCLGHTRSQAFSLIGTDEGSFVLTSVSALDAPFTVSTPPLPATVQGLAGNTVKLTVEAAPTAQGESSASFRFDTDIPMGTPHTINLHMLGLAEGVSGPPSVDLGGNLVNQTSLGQHVEISNCTAAPVTIRSVNIDGTDAADFTIVDQPSDLTIMPAASINWLVILDPHSTGEKSAVFNALFDGGATAVPLIGEGLGSSLGSGDGEGAKSSYYACNTGSPVGAAPIGIALGALALRRRRRASQGCSARVRG